MKKKKHLLYQMNFGMLNGWMLYITELNASAMEEKGKCLHCLYVIQLSGYIHVVYLMHALQWYIGCMLLDKITYRKEIL